MKKRLNLEELELRLPKIDEKNSKILLGGSDYDGADDEACRFCAQLTFGEGKGSGGQEHMTMVIILI